MARLSSEQLHRVRRVLVTEQQVEIEKVAALKSLDHATQLLRGDFKRGVGSDGDLGQVGPALEQRALHRVDHQLVIREVKLDRSRCAQRSYVPDTIGGAVERQRFDRIGSGSFQRSSDHLPAVRFRALDDGVVEVGGVAVVLDVEEPERGPTLEDEPLLGVVRRDERRRCERGHSRARRHVHRRRRGSRPS